MPPMPPKPRRFAVVVLLLFLLGLVAGVAPAALAQGPDAGWRTLSTPHFRVHYPAPFAAWAQRAASWLEEIRRRAIAEIGFTPADVVDVVIADPQADANGEALPLRGWPRLVLWTTPPPADSEIGHYRDWTEDLLVHEEAHLVHLLRPSRNSLLAALLPVSPIVLAPRWVLEGYATVIEGRLTGSGRPNSDLRAAILRRWAQAGVLPSYGRLASDAHSWHGMSMAYLLGSAYLEWLDQRAGPGSLRRLWARMTARTGRSFDEAFAGIWGNTPESLYDRFRAELTWRAMEAERRVQAVGPLAAREGALWQELSWTTGAPAVSADGSRLALVRHSREKPAELVVWSTADDVEAERRWQEAQARQQTRDPQDVPAVRAKPLRREPLYTWSAADGGNAETPRFMPDGESLLLARYLPDRQGFLHPDLFVWRPAAGAVAKAGGMRRITWQADLRDADPSPDGAWAVAVRDRYGLSQLVIVDLASGAVRALTEPSVEKVYDRPRLSPEGRRVAFGLHDAGEWRLAVLELTADRTAGRQVEIAAPTPGAATSAPAWSPDGRTLYAVVGQGGFVDLYAFSADPDQTAAGTSSPPPPRALTRTQGAALAPAPTPDGKAVFYLSLEPYGLDLRRLDLALAAGRPPLAEVNAPATLSPAVRPPAEPAPPPLPAPLLTTLPLPTPPVDLPYGTGRQELLPLISGGAGSAGGTLELGARSGDLIGKLDLVALAGIGSPGSPRGGTVAGAWRGWPLEVGLQVFDVREQPSRQAGTTPASFGLAGEGLDLERRGVGADAVWDRRGAGDRLRLRLGLLFQDLDAAPALLAGASPPHGAAREELALGEASYLLHRRFGLWRFAASSGLRLAGGTTSGDGFDGMEGGARQADGGWVRYGGDLAVALAHRETRLTLSGRRDGSHGVNRAFDLYQLGGAATSLEPASALAARLVSPALPAATLVGAEHAAERIELTAGFAPLPLFWERHRLWGGPFLPHAAEMTLAGAEYRAAIEPFPLVRLPALELRLGVARLFGDPTPWLAHDRTRWWLTSVVRP